ncbi:MAG: MBL fold metallo-hydrolase, partial [Rhodoferax sp.]
LGVKPLLLQWGLESVQELDWWESVNVRGTEFHFTPTQHWSARGLGDESETLWGAWAVFSDALHWYFVGDTGYSQDFTDTRRHFADRHTDALGGGFDLALLPVGAYEPRWFMQGQHVNPSEALQIHLDIGAKRSVGIHWGTFALADEAIDQAPKDLQVALHKAASPKLEFQTLAIGETVNIQMRQVHRD